MRAVCERLTASLRKSKLAVDSRTRRVLCCSHTWGRSKRHPPEVVHDQLLQSGKTIRGSASNTSYLACASSISASSAAALARHACSSSTRSTVQRLTSFALSHRGYENSSPIIRTTGRSGLALLTCQPDGPGQSKSGPGLPVQTTPRPRPTDRIRPFPVGR
jgi:hypothetical protein